MLSALVQAEISNVLAAAASLPGSQQQLACIAEATAAAGGSDDDLTELEIEAVIEAELAAAGLVSNGLVACSAPFIPAQQQQQWPGALGAYSEPGFDASSTSAAAAAPAVQLHSRFNSLQAEYAQLQQVLLELQQVVGQQQLLGVNAAEPQMSMYTVSGNHSTGSWY
jgi:hypothetical protein